MSLRPTPAQAIEMYLYGPPARSLPQRRPMKAFTTLGDAQAEAEAAGAHAVDVCSHGTGPECSQATDDAGRTAGSSGGAAAAGTFFGPEAAPIGAAVGGYIGGHLREWVGNTWSMVKGWFGGGSAPCECQLGACYADEDEDIAAGRQTGEKDTLSMEKYGVLASQCPSPEVMAVIEQQVMAQTQPMLDRGDDFDEVNRIRICARLAAFAKCRDEGWAAPKTSAADAWAAADAECKAQGMRQWNGTNCVAWPKVPVGCPGQGWVNGLLHGYMGPEGCVYCPTGVKTHDEQGNLMLQFDSNNNITRWWECLPDDLPGLSTASPGPTTSGFTSNHTAAYTAAKAGDTSGAGDTTAPTGIVAKFKALSTPTKVAVGVGTGAAIWAAVRYAMGKAILPVPLQGKTS